MQRDDLRIPEAYGEAKNRADVQSALAVCTDDFYLEAVALGTHAAGKDEAAAHLAAFFHAFPDYRATTSQWLACGNEVVAVGTITSTFTGELFGIAPTHRHFRYDFVSVYELRVGRLAGERFFFDLDELARGLAVDRTELQAALANAAELLGSTGLQNPPSRSAAASPVT